MRAFLCWTSLLATALIHLRIFWSQDLRPTSPSPQVALPILHTPSVDAIPTDATGLQQPEEVAKVALRHEIYALSGHAIPLPLLMRVALLDELKALVATYRSIEQGEAVLVVHAHQSLPRRLLALCSARALARRARWKLLLIWVTDRHVGANFSQLFDPEPTAGFFLGAVGSFWNDLLPASLFEHLDLTGPEAVRRSRPLRLQDRETSVYVRLSATLEASPPISPADTAACLRGLQPVRPVRQLISQLVGQIASPSLDTDGTNAPNVTAASSQRRGDDHAGQGRAALMRGLHFRATAAAGDRDCSTSSFASKLAELEAKAPVSRHVPGGALGSPEASAEGTQVDSSESSSFLSVDPWPQDSLLAPLTQSPSRRLSLRSERLAACEWEPSMSTATSSAAPLGSAGPQGGARSVGCLRVALAEWRLLALAPQLLLTQGSAFSDLVAATAFGTATSVTFGCRGQWTDYAPYVPPPYRASRYLPRSHSESHSESDSESEGTAVAADVGDGGELSSDISGVGSTGVGSTGGAGGGVGSRGGDEGGGGEGSSGGRQL